MLSSPTPQSDVSSSGGVWLSGLFWLGLGIASFFNGVLVLSPRVLEQVRLQQRFDRNAAVLSHLQAENAHLAELAHAFKTDADFRARVTATELNAVPAGGRRLPVADKLAFDPRVPPAHEPALTAPQQNWSLSVLEICAQSTQFRRRCTIAAIAVLLFSFFCCHDGFLAGSIGAALSTCGQLARGRYSAGDELPGE